MKKVTLLFVLWAAYALSVFGQRLNHVLGDVLVKTTPAATIRDLTNHLQTFKGQRTELEVVESVVKSMRIWRLHFDFTKVNEYEFLQQIRRQTEVEMAQFNHISELRSTIPNDPQFPQQWQYINNGSNGGVAGADIDADLAWDITTGGLTSAGDTIVVCVIDNGLDPTHQDFGDNIWVNYAEIPDNGLDDDNNGFVDDRFGWNTSSNDDDIDDLNWHGTPVTGIVGARGNNGLGVAGVNWNVKLMIVVGGTGVESEVLEAYSYPLNNRKKYNETNGAEGAFVVATNASWGVNMGQPDDAPLWCAFYDSLGTYGILNAGATANANFNIDEVGDLPTACSSDFMISVTNMNRSDIKVTQAGFGTETIDLGAFGESTWTVAIPNNYGGFGGTSGATPHVTGAIALFYSAPCPSIAAIAHADPKAAALMIRQYLFDGVDHNQSLEGITVTEGRLNIFNSIQMIMANCSACPVPFGIGINDVTDVKASISWSVTDSTLNTIFRYRVLGDTVWMESDSVQSPKLLTNLFACTEYEFQLRAICADTASDFSQNFIFKTDGCCEPPTNLKINDIDFTSATADWNSVLAANSYNLLLTWVDTSALFENITQTSFPLTDLLECQVYGVQIQTVCDTGTTNFGTLIEFETMGCGACTDLIYCAASSADASEEWIGNVTLNTLNNTSESNDGFGDFTGETTNLEQFKTYQISLTPEFQGNAFSEYFTAWIDYNQDGDFGDSGEEVFDPGNLSSQTVTGSVVIPPAAVPGLTRLRVIMRFNEKPGACDDGFNFGEVEDYCVNILKGEPPECSVPSNFTAYNIGFSTTTLGWDTTANALNYKLRYRQTAAGDWTELEVNDTTTTVNNLMDCTEYEFQVQSVCFVGITSAWSESMFITTQCLPPCDQIPGGVDTVEVTENSATIKWENVAAADSYRVKYLDIATQNLFILQTIDTSAILLNLTDCNDYQYFVQAICPNGQSDFSDTLAFQTVCITATDDLEIGLNNLRIFPNPFNGDIFLNFLLEKSEDFSFELFNAAGKRFFVKNQQFSAGDNQLPLAISPSLPAGIYFLKIGAKKGFSIRKLVKK